MKYTTINVSICIAFLSIIISCSNDYDLNFQTSNQTIYSPLNKPSTPIQSNEVVIGNQIWMLKNLNVTRYRNGDIIPQVQDQNEWSTLTTGAWCYHSNLTANGLVYGKLYNWYAVNDVRGLAPQGWHIPANTEFQTLNTYLGSTMAGKKMRATILWISDNGDNSSNFTALPGGFRYTSFFGGLGVNAIFWSSTEYDEGIAWNRLLIRNSNLISSINQGVKTDGCSVRCIKN
jgi:uncharacterized protein (TIGR02145 family)